jgi:hypothetical protein
LTAYGRAEVRPSARYQALEVATMNELQQLAEAELVWIELALELAYAAECEAFLQGRQDGVPDPREYGLTEALACQIAVEAHAAEVARTAAWYAEAASAYDAVRRVG